MSKFRAPLFFLILGVLIGGYLFSRTQPRSLLSLNRCENCWAPRELAGLVASAGINRFPALIPKVEFETDKTIVIKNPFPIRAANPDNRDAQSVDYLIFPKKDIKNIGEFSEEDAAYIADAFLVARHIIEQNKSTMYRVFTNGPGFQDIGYLHFHLLLRTASDQS